MPAMVPLAALLLIIAGEGGVADPSPGTVAVTLTGASGDGQDDDQPYADAVGQALGEASFTIMPALAHGRYLALVSVMRESRGVVAAKVPKGRAAAAIGSWGPMVAVPLGSGKTQLSDLMATTLTVRLVSQTDRRLVWSGSAVTVRTGATTAPDRLARAVVAAFPRTLSSPVSVP